MQQDVKTTKPQPPLAYQGKRGGAQAEKGMVGAMQALAKLQEKAPASVQRNEPSMRELSQGKHAIGYNKNQPEVLQNARNPQNMQDMQDVPAQGVTKRLQIQQDRSKPAPRIGQAEINKATVLLQRYKDGKAALDRRIVDNELWFKMAHWKQYQNRLMDRKAQPASGWLFNSIANKHADAMDNYPTPIILPRAEEDANTAKELSSILPVLLERCDYEQVYSDTWWYKLKQGTGVKGVFWDNSKCGSLGDVSIRKMDLLMLFWEPGVMDIQDSPHFFSLALVGDEQLIARYPQMKGKTGRALNVATYVHDDAVDTGDKSIVVDWYYKVNVGGKVLVHYCKYCNGEVLYASENEAALAHVGFYDHGMYPFVFDTLFVEEDTPAGFGYIDIMKDCQTAIDKMNHVMQENAILASKPRYFLADNTGVNEEELTDFSRDVVHFSGRLTEENFRQQGVDSLAGNSLTYLNNRIEELKETSGNRDFSQGGTASGVTAAAAITALQEAGSKLSRDMLKSAYRSFVKECYLCIELMRQFYDEPRMFRVTGEGGNPQFSSFSNKTLRAQPMGTAFGQSLGAHSPEFDVNVTAQKKSSFSTLAQNETAKELYRLGLFSPANATPALACLEMMDFEGIAKVRERISENSAAYQQAQKTAELKAASAALQEQLATQSGKGSVS